MAFSPTISGNNILSNGNPLTIRGPVSSSAYTIQQNVIAGSSINLGTSAANHFERAVAGISMTSNGLFGGSISLVANTTTLPNAPTISSNLLFGGITTLNCFSSSISYNSNINNGTLTVNNRFTSSVGSAASVLSARANVNTIYGTGHVINFDGTNVTSTQGKSASYNILAGTFLTASVGDGDNSAVNATGVIGNGLVVSGSTLPSTFSGNDTANSGQGSLFGGRFNAQDGSKSKTGETVFAIGTGTSYTNRKTGFLIDSGSNTFVEGTLNVSGSTSFNGDVIITGSLTASLQQGFVLVGDASGRTQAVATSSFSGGGGATFPFTGSAQITGSLGITGSFNGTVTTLTVTSGTASIDMNVGNFFNLNLPTSSVTNITVTNIRPGQTINLQVSQSSAATGSVTFPSNIRFAGGFDYTATAITGALDLISFVSFDSNQILATSVKNLL
jgi:hypothetical protein